MKKVVLLSVVLLMAALPAFAGAIYGLSSSFPGAIYSLDTSTGAATLVAGLSGDSLGSSLVGLEGYGGLLYASDIFLDGPMAFGSIGPATGVFTTVNTQGGNQYWESLAVDPATGTFYTVETDLSPDYPLVGFTLSGTIAQIGNTLQSIRGLAFDNNHAILYGVTDTELFVINTATGATTEVGDLGIDAPKAGLAYDPTTDVLYLNTGDGGVSNPDNFKLFSVDVSTGAATEIGPNGDLGDPGTFGIDGLAYLDEAVPEPSTVGLVALGILGLAAARRRLKA